MWTSLEEFEIIEVHNSAKYKKKPVFFYVNVSFLCRDVTYCFFKWKEIAKGNELLCHIAVKSNVAGWDVISWGKLTVTEGCVFNCIQKRQRLMLLWSSMVLWELLFLLLNLEHLTWLRHKCTRLSVLFVSHPSSSLSSTVFLEIIVANVVDEYYPTLKLCCTV